MLVSEFDEDSVISKVKITAIRKTISNGPLFPKYTVYSAIILVWDNEGNFQQLTKDYGRTTFSKLQKALEDSKQEWLAKGLTADMVRIDYTNCNPS